MTTRSLILVVSLALVFADPALCVDREPSCQAAGPEDSTQGSVMVQLNRMTSRGPWTEEPRSATTSGSVALESKGSALQQHKVSRHKVLDGHLKADSPPASATEVFVQSAVTTDKNPMREGHRRVATEKPLANATKTTLFQGLLRPSKEFRHQRESSVVGQAAAAAGAVIALGWGFGHSGSTKASGEDRSMLLDNAKVCSLFFVIFGHFLFYNLSGEFTGQKVWLAGSEDTMKLLMGVISPLKLPIFCLISGICSQGETTPGRLRRFFVFLVVPTCIWVFFVKPVIYDTLVDGSFGSLWERFKQAMLLNSFHNEWYLQALIFWRGSTLLIWNQLRPSVALVGMFLVSLAGGYMSFGSGAAVNLKIDETLGFLPYFAIGYVFPYEWALQAIPKPRPLGSLLVLVAVVAYSWWLAAKFEGAFPNGHGPYGAISDQQAWAAAGHDSLAHRMYWLRRLAKVLLDLAPGLIFMFLVLPRGVNFLSWAGQHTLYPYVWHLMAMTWFDMLMGSLALPEVKSVFGQVGVISLNAVVCLVILMAFSSWPWRSLFSWCFHPTWLQFDIEKCGPLHVSCSTPRSGSSSDAVRSDRGLEGGRGLASGALADPRKPKPGAPHPPDQRVEQDKAVGREDSGSDPEASPPKRTLSRASFPSCSTLNGSACTGTGSRASRESFKTSVQLPTMRDSKAFCKYVLPSVVFLIVAPVLYFFVVVGPNAVIEMLLHVPLWLFVPVGVSGMIYSNFVRYYYHFRRLAGNNQPPPPLPPDSEPLLHVCVVVEYKEPMEVLLRTVASIAKQSSIRRRPVLVMATEARDTERHETCEALRKLCGDSLEGFMMTEHVLQPGEIVGKHSNENHAVREVYRHFVEEQDTSAFQIMMTIIDADSILSQYYLAHVESAFYKMPDGRRLIYNGPLNTYRNLDEARLLVQATEIARCHVDVFHDPLIAYHPQSNYSMTLGMVQEIDFWLPDCISEDMKCHVKALTNNFGSQTTVAIPAFICNDLVSGIGDRYVQAKRHQWGSVEEFPWHLKLAWDSPMDLRLWWTVFSDECSRQGSIFAVCANVLAMVASASLLGCIVLYRRDFIVDPRFFVIAAAVVVQFVSFWTAEILLWNRHLGQFAIQWPSNCRLALIVVLYPILQLISGWVFCFGATFDCILHMTFKSHYLTYVNAPKGTQQGGS